MSSSSTEAAVEVTMPQMGVSVAEGTVLEWKVAVGDVVAAEQTVCDISTDKIDSEVPAPAAGVVAEIVVPAGETVAVGTVLARLNASAPADSHNGHAQLVQPAAKHTSFSPIVQRIAAEHDIDLSKVKGTGRGGRVRKQDVLAVVHGRSEERSEEPPLHTESPYRPEPAPAGQLSHMRRQIGDHMKRSLQTTATCTTWIEVDMSWVEGVRARRGLTALAFVARATVEALREHPALNAWLEGGSYTRFSDEVHLGIAVSLDEDGLIVPVVRDAHLLSAEGLGARARELARRARARELTPDDVRGGTFTITNPGQFGSIMATPIINLPQVAILDFEAVVKRAVVVTAPDGTDAVGIRPMTILGLSWDHRALDGAQAAQFLACVKRHLETGSAA